MEREEVRNPCRMTSPDCNPADSIRDLIADPQRIERELKAYAAMLAISAT